MLSEIRSSRKQHKTASCAKVETSACQRITLQELALLLFLVIRLEQPAALLVLYITSLCWFVLAVLLELRSKKERV